jgi:hypothetical protein
LGYRLTQAAVAVTDAIGYRSRSIGFGLALAAVAVTDAINRRRRASALHRFSRDLDLFFADRHELRQFLPDLNEVA